MKMKTVDLIIIICFSIMIGMQLFYSIMRHSNSFVICNYKEEIVKCDMRGTNYKSFEILDNDGTIVRFSTR